MITSVPLPDLRRVAATLAGLTGRSVVEATLTTDRRQLRLTLDDGEILVVRLEADTQGRAHWSSTPRPPEGRIPQGREPFPSQNRSVAPPNAGEGFFVRVQNFPPIRGFRSFAAGDCGGHASSENRGTELALSGFPRRLTQNDGRTYPDPSKRATPVRPVPPGAPCQWALSSGGSPPVAGQGSSPRVG